MFLKGKYAQHAEGTLNETKINLIGTMIEWKSMHQGLRIYFGWNPRLKAIETAN